jgi:hypothetical protein
MDDSLLYPEIKVSYFLHLMIINKTKKKLDQFVFP